MFKFYFVKTVRCMLFGIQECVDGSDALKSESVRKVLRIAVRRAASLPGDVVDSPAATDCVGQQTFATVPHQPTYTDASVSTDPISGIVLNM